MTIARCVIFETHLALLLLGQGYSTGGLVWSIGPSGRALNDCKLALTLAFSVSKSPNWTPPNWRQQAPVGRAHWLQTGSHSGLHYLQIINCRGHLHILFRNSHLLPIRSYDLLPLITQVHLWLTARSRVNM